MANSRICSIPKCGNTHYAKGYCNAHYKRLKKHGGPLAGGTSRGEPLRWILEVALHHTGDECLIWPFGKDGGGYGQIWIDGKVAITSRYICELVNGAPPTPEHEAAHSCGKGHETCVSPIHMSWKTPAENAADRLIHGTHGRGERSAHAKLTESEAREILALKGIEKQVNLAKRFMVSQMTISRIQAGRKWAWLQAAE
ncbi:hypothetical protein ACVIRO_002316 [Rhizobium ruizarguesonis]